MNTVALAGKGHEATEARQRTGSRGAAARAGKGGGHAGSRRHVCVSTYMYVTWYSAEIISVRFARNIHACLYEIYDAFSLSEPTSCDHLNDMVQYVRPAVMGWACINVYILSHA